MNKGHNDDEIHVSRDKNEDNNVNTEEQGSNISGDHDPLSYYSSKVRSDDEECSSDNNEVKVDKKISWIPYRRRWSSN